MSETPEEPSPIRPTSAATSSPPIRRFRCGRSEAVERDAQPALAAPPDPAVPLGLYLHIPFCRKRCHFCYFRVYTDKNAQEVGAVPRRAGARVGAVRAAAGDCRTAAQLRLLRRRHAVVSVDAAAAERWSSRLTAVDAVERRRGDHVRVRAGHADRSQARGDPAMGVTRLSLGVENFDDRILELNGRAHRSPEIGAGLSRSRATLDFPQINIDLIAGMLGETEENWQRVRRRRRWRSSPTASRSTRWSCPSTRRSARTC